MLAPDKIRSAVSEIRSYTYGPSISISSVTAAPEGNVVREQPWLKRLDRGVTVALALGAAGMQIGSAYLRCHEAISPSCIARH